MLSYPGSCCQRKIGTKISNRAATNINPFSDSCKSHTRAAAFTFPTPVLYPTVHPSANGLPLGAERDERRSTFQFLREKERQCAVRLYTGPPVLHEIKLPSETESSMQLLSLPMYLVGQLDRLLQETFGW
jgi:hypothetical protein